MTNGHKTMLMVTGASLAICLLAASAAAQDKKKPDAPKDKPATTQPAEEGPMCPVMQDDPIDPTIWVRYHGKRVYLCCGECVDKFKSDPDKFAEGIRKQWEAMRPIRVQVKCPVSGEPVNQKFLVELPDRDVFFANADAQEKFRKDKKAYLKKLDEECYTFQSRCPTCDKDIDPSISLQVKGRMIYFCCSGCVEPFKNDTALGMKKVDERVKANEEKFKKAEKARAP